MRVLHVVASEQRRGAEVFASALVESLARNEVDQRVAVLHASSGRQVSFSAPTAMLGATNVSVPGIRMNVTGVKNLGRVIASFRPDVVQVHGGEPLKYALAATQGAGDRIVYRRIGDAAWFGGSRVRQRAYAGLMRRTARVVAVADALRVELVDRFGLAPSRVVTIPNGADVGTLVPSRTRDEVRAALGIRQDAQVVLSLGALTWEKDPLGQLEVVARAAIGRPRLVHVMAGAGPLLEELQAEILRRGARSRTMLLGSRDDVADLLAASDAMLLASKTEGMPACAIEAGLCGLPVVGYAVSGIPEVVISGETGFLVPAGDAVGLAGALARLMDDEALRHKMGEAARVWCRTRFDIRTVAPRYLRLYEEIAEESLNAVFSRQGIRPRQGIR